jgi:hypothetical protein
VPGTNASRDHVSGVKERVEGGGNTGRFDVRDGYDQPGSDFANFPTRGSGECLERCDAESRCVAFTYNRSTGYCYLKDRSNGLRPRSDHVSGVRR